MGSFRAGGEKAGCTNGSDTQGGAKEGSELRYSASQLNVNLLSLPSVALRDRRLLPKKTVAVYFAVSENNEVLYIGRAVCLHTRWNGQKHHKQARLNQLGKVRIAWMIVSDRALLAEIEYALIKHFKPPLNLVNNPFASPVSRKEEVRGKAIKVRLTEAEYEWLKQQSKLRDVPAAHIIREGIRKVMAQEAVAS